MASGWLGWGGDSRAVGRSGGQGGSWRLRTYNPRMTTLFVSDLHLDPERPAITRLFAEFLDREARAAEALYILGDLFEAWVGDDDPSDTGAFVAHELRALADAG